MNETSENETENNDSDTDVIDSVLNKNDEPNTKILENKRIEKGLVFECINDFKKELLLYMEETSQVFVISNTRTKGANGEKIEDENNDDQQEDEDGEDGEDEEVEDGEDGNGKMQHNGNYFKGKQIKFRIYKCKHHYPLESKSKGTSQRKKKTKVGCNCKTQIRLNLEERGNELNSDRGKYKITSFIINHNHNVTTCSF